MTSLTLPQVLDMWLQNRPQSTARIYRSNLKIAQRLAQEAFKADVRILTTQQLMVVAAQLTQGYEMSTTAFKICILKSFFTFLQKVALRADNPAAALKVPKFPDKLAQRITTHEKVLELVSAAQSEEEKLMLLVLYYAGLRVSEVCSLKRKDISKTPAGITLRVEGKGQRADYVLLAPSIGEMLTKFVESRTTDQYIFQHNGTAYKTIKVWRLLKRLGRVVGVPEISPHWLRHTHASVALENKASLPEIQKSLRHRNIETTMRYLHLKPSQSSSLYLPTLPKD